jgi:hypothetical protein
MFGPLPILIENSVEIAWDYLERAGELGNRMIASKVLFYPIEKMIQTGKRRRLMLSNKAIIENRKFRSEREAA